MTISDNLDVNKELDLRLLDMLTAKRLGYYVQSFDNKREWGARWTSYALMTPSGEKDGDHYSDPITAWCYPYSYHSSMANAGLLHRLGQKFGFGTTEFDETATEQFKKDNAYWCRIWNDAIDTSSHAPTLPLAILIAWHDFYELTHPDIDDTNFMAELRERFKKDYDSE